ncbi:hypothetical protein [Peterkaempfera sp. SMS 1(5)a]|uniref:hypothetical protein n=1 Tax=Peterkaempfera podocarpi TaxID=3232308 RepID=UPI00366F622A
MQGALEGVTAWRGGAAAVGQTDGQPLVLQRDGSVWQRQSLPAFDGDASLVGVVRDGAQLTAVGTATDTEGHAVPLVLRR